MEPTTVESRSFCHVIDALVDAEPVEGWPVPTFFQLLNGTLYEEHDEREDVGEEMVRIAQCSSTLLAYAEDLLALDLARVVHQSGVTVAREDFDELWECSAQRAAESGGRFYEYGQESVAPFVRVRLTPVALSWTRRDHLRLASAQARGALRAPASYRRPALSLWVNPRWRARRIYDAEPPVVIRTDWR